MNKKLWLNVLCGLTLVCNTIGAAEAETTEMLHAALGDRKADELQYALDVEKRLTIVLEAEEGAREPATANLEPSEEMLAACRDCRLDEDVNEKPVPLARKNVYVTTHPNALHYVIAVTMPFGTPVQLEDGSLWTVYSGDCYKTLNWLTTDNILILPNRNKTWGSLYPYTLFNQQTGVSVQATYSQAPWSNGAYTRWIYSIDYFNGQLVLNDGSIWSVPFCDLWILDSFQPGDYVVMGFNDVPGNGLGANILINFQTLQYVYTNCIYY